MGALGETIRHLRQARGLSARALAEAAGLPYGAVQDIERQRSKNPKSETLRRIAKALGVFGGAFGGGAGGGRGAGRRHRLGAPGRMAAPAGVTPWRRQLSRRHPHARRIGFLVADSHADRHYGEGAVLFCIDRAAWSRKLRRGDRVVVRIRESGQIMNLCMVVDISAAGDIVLTTASSNPRQQFEAVIRRDRSNGRRHGLSERSYFTHRGEQPAEIDYAPGPDDAVTIDYLVVGHVE